MYWIPYKKYTTSKGTIFVTSPFIKKQGYIKFFINFQKKSALDLRGLKFILYLLHSSTHINIKL